MISKKQIDIYDIFKINVICCISLLMLSILIYLSYVIFSIFIISLNYDIYNFICLYDIISVCVVALNLFSNIIFCYYDNFRHKSTYISLLTINSLIIVSGIILFVINNKIDDLVILGIIGNVVHLKSCLIFTTLLRQK